MRILIVGGGKLGHSLTQNLVSEGHEVTVVEQNDAVLQRNQDTVDALFIKGNGVSADVLTEADVQHTDILIAATAGDEVNMLCCLLGKKLGAQYTIARIRDPAYLSSIGVLQNELHIDYAINPERSTAREISRMLRFPSAGSVETFARGRVEMMDLVAQEGDPIVGIPLRDIYTKNRRLPRVLFSAVQRNGDMYIPKGDFVIQPGDRVHVVSDLQTVTAFFSALGRGIETIRSVVIMGGSRIAFYLASMLLEMRSKVTIVEIDPARARSLSELLPAANIVLGDGTDRNLLESEGLLDAQAFVLLAGRDEDNLMAGLAAARSGVKKVIVKSSRDNYGDIMQDLGLESIISVKSVARNSILRTVRTRASRSSAGVHRVYRMMDGHTEALEFVAEAGMPYIHVPLKDLSVSRSCLICVIVHEGRVRIPFGNDTIEADDRVIVISSKTGISALGEVLRKD